MAGDAAEERRGQRRAPIAEGFGVNTTPAAHALNTRMANGM